MSISVPPDEASHLRTRDVLLFLVFSHGWTWAFWLLAGLTAESVWDFPAVIFLIVGGAGVFMGGLAMSRITYGRGGIRDLALRTIDPRPISAYWWAIVVLFFPVIVLISAAIASVTGVTTEPVDLRGALERLANPLQLLGLMAFILIMGPLPEEIGWRGYLLDRLQLRWSALVASLVLGVIWWSWHLPLLVLPGYYEAFGMDAPGALDFLWALLPAAVLYTWVYNNTGRSILAVVIFHFMQNFSSEFAGVSLEMRPVMLALMILVAVGVIWYWGPRRLDRRDTTATHQKDR